MHHLGVVRFSRPEFLTGQRTILECISAVHHPDEDLLKEGRVPRRWTQAPLGDQWLDCAKQQNRRCRRFPSAKPVFAHGLSGECADGLDVP